MSGGPAETLCDVVNFVGGTWTRDDVILFSDTSKNGIMRVPAHGGTPVQVTTVDKARAEGGHFNPWALADGRHFLYQRASSTDGNRGIYVGDANATPDAQDLTRLVAASQVGAVYAAGNGSPGSLLFLRDGLLMAQTFDEASRSLAGEATAVVDQVGSYQIFGSFSVSANGTLAYLGATSDTGSLVWIARNGTESSAPIAAGLKNPQNLRLSPDGRSLAVIVAGDVWRYDLEGRPPIKVTLDGSHFSPASTSSRRCACSSAPPGTSAVNNRRRMTWHPMDGS